MVHNYYQTPGGEDESFRDEVRILDEAGHRVDTYVEHNDRIRHMSPVLVGARTLWSVESFRQVRNLLTSQGKADVLHVQNFFPLVSPSVYYAAKQVGVPVVQTLHNYRLICPSGLLFREGRICTECVNKRLPLPGLRHSCYRNNRLATGAIVSMIGLHRLLGSWTRSVDVFITLTEFSRGLFIEAGLPADRIVVKPNFVYPDPGEGTQSEGFALYVGRLTPEKGLGTLIDTWDRLSGKLKLVIAGEGPLEERIRLAQSRNPSIQWVGRRTIQEVYDLMGKASMVIVPSEWHEPFGRIIIEAFAKGTPVIGARTGAIPHLVDHGHTGLLFEPGNPESLYEQVASACNNLVKWKEMGRHARQTYLRRFTASANLEQLMAIYDLAQSRAGKMG